MAKLKLSVEEGRYYEAHQMYRTLYFRCVTARGTARPAVALGVGVSTYVAGVGTALIVAVLGHVEDYRA